MANHPKNLCLLGAGRMGQMHARSFVGHPRARLIAVADVAEDAARALAAPFGAKALPKMWETSRGSRCSIGISLPQAHSRSIDEVGPAT